MLKIIKRNILKIVYIFVLVSFIAPAIITAFLLMDLKNHVSAEMMDIQKTKYGLMLLQSIVGIVVINIPLIFRKILKIRIPSILYITYMIFLFCAIFLGEIRHYYITISYWDDILHLVSSLMTGFFGFMLVFIINNKAEYNKLRLSPFFIAMFAFSFSVTIGVLWEIYEFAVDFLGDFNMQKYRMDDGTPLIGENAIFDTMKDLIIDTIGALIASVTVYFSIRRESSRLRNYLKNEMFIIRNPSESDNSHFILREETVILSDKKEIVESAVKDDFISLETADSELSASDKEISSELD